jgi:hypothetical protein
MEPSIALKLLLAFLLPLVSALKFDIQAHPGHESASKERCIRNFVAKDQLVVVTATVSGNRGDGMTLNMHVSSPNTKPFPPAQHTLTDTISYPDQRRSRQRLRPPPRRRRRGPLRLHLARRQRLRRLLRERPHRLLTLFQQPLSRRGIGYRHWR